MGWLEDYLAQYAPAQNALLQAATGTGVPTGPAPGGGGPDNLAPPNPPADPVDQLLAAYKAYQKAGPGDRPRPDPLLNQASMGLRRRTSLGTPSPMRILRAGKPITPRGGGDPYFGVDLGGGKKASIRFDKRGRRSVNVW
jgi:hypothetical protein